MLYSTNQLSTYAKGWSSTEDAAQVQLHDHINENVQWQPLHKEEHSLDFLQP